MSALLTSVLFVFMAGAVAGAGTVLIVANLFYRWGKAK